MVAWTGLDAPDLPLHPVWGACVSAFGALSFPASMAVRLNLLSLVCGVVAAVLLFRLVSFFVFQTVGHESVTPFAAAAARLGGLAAAVAFVFAAPVWQASTHLEYRIFDVAFALAAFALLVPLARHPRFTVLFIVLAGLVFGAGAVESVVFLPLLPVYLLLLIAVLRRNERLSFAPVALFLAVAAIAFGALTWAVVNHYAAAVAGAGEPMDVAVGCWRLQAHEIHLWFRRPGWLFVVLLGVLPFVACGFASVRGLNNERSWSQYVFHFAMTICVVLAAATPLSPASLMRPFGVLPVAVSTLVAVAAGYLAAYWYLLFRTPPPVAEFDAPPLAETVGHHLGATFGAIFAVVLVFTAVIDAFSCGRGRGRYADVCAAGILDRLGARTWFVTDGLLDDHLRVLARSRGRELNLVCLQRDLDDAYLKRLGALVKDRGLKAGKADLSMTLTLGVLPFLQDWFAGDPDVAAKAAVFGAPDFWYSAGRVPAPECIFFGGVRSAKEFDGAGARAGFEAFWKEIAPILWADRPGSMAISRATDPVDALRLQLRRHVGFVANNLGVALQDCGRDADAFAIYELVRGTIDPDNVSALFNEFEMARAGFPAAAAKRGAIERDLNALVADTTRRYVLWSLSRYYGYIRSPEIFARMGYGWALSGQTGAAISQVKRAFEFVPSDRQSGLLNMMAAIYALGDEKGKSRAAYQQVVSADPANHDALMGLARLSMQDGEIDKARGYLSKAVHSAGTKDASDLEWAIIYLMNNDLARARLSLQAATDLQPKNLQAWGLLAHVLLQQAEQAGTEPARKKIIDELEGVIIPKMEALAGGPKDYYVQITRALVLMRKGKDSQKSARDALLAAYNLRPDVAAVADMILRLDIAMDDGESAESHARQVLRSNRKNPLANYVIGSLRLKGGDYGAAETFLRASVDTEKPLAAAQNDLAEVLRRERNLPEAETYARAAVKNAPDLYVAWETLGAVLLDQNKDLAEAEKFVQKAIDLCRQENKTDDIRMQITLARVQLARGDAARARGTIRTLRSRQNELSEFDRDQLAKLSRAAEATK